MSQNRSSKLKKKSNLNAENSTEFDNVMKDHY